MSFLGLDYENTYQPTTKQPGEYKLRILSAELKKSSNTGNDYLALRFEVADDPVAKDIYHVMMLPAPDDTPKKRNSRTMAIKTLCASCGVDPSVVTDPNELVGLECWAILVEEADPEYGTQNRIRSFAIGR